MAKRKIKNEPSTSRSTRYNLRNKRKRDASECLSEAFTESESDVELSLDILEEAEQKGKILRENVAAIRMGKTKMETLERFIEEERVKMDAKERIMVVLRDETRLIEQKIELRESVNMEVFDDLVDIPIRRESGDSTYISLEEMARNNSNMIINCRVSLNSTRTKFFELIRQLADEKSEYAHRKKDLVKLNGKIILGHKEVVEKKNECGVCTMEFSDDNLESVIKGCGHRFCETCLGKIEMPKKCPLCSREFDFSDITRIYN